MKTSTKSSGIIKTAAIRDKAESSLINFIKLVAPHRVLGSIHEEICQWWYSETTRDHTVLLLPRDHQKSALLGYSVAYDITLDPTLTFLYISATSTLAETQLRFIKAVLDNPTYRRYWPEMIHQDVSKREKWTNAEICVDHPLRAKEGIRDSTIFTAGLTTTITGLHFTRSCLDDVVVKENAYTEEGRRKVKEQYSLLASIESVGAKSRVVGTRYHPKDLYGDLIEMEHDIYNDEGDHIGVAPVYDVMQKVVEDRGDGTGEFLWPRQKRPDGTYFGFDANILAKKKAKYLDKTQFRAQYYNDPNDTENAEIRDYFQYYDRSFINQDGAYWFYKNNRLNVVAAIDFAFSTRKTADYTAIVVVGIDKDRNIYVLDIARFKTDKISDYYREIMKLFSKWEFPKLRAEVTVAQDAIVEELKNSYLKPNGINLRIEKFRPTRNIGTKEERIEATLKPKYENNSVWHYKGGNCQILEDELCSANPAHDDVKDALHSAIETAHPPINVLSKHKKESNIVYGRFGGIA